MTLYVLAAVVLPILVVAAVIGLDRLLEFSQQRRPFIFPMLVLMQVVALIGTLVDGGSPRLAVAHGLAIPVIIAGWIYDRAKERREGRLSPVDAAGREPR